MSTRVLDGKVIKNIVLEKIKNRVEKEQLTLKLVIIQVGDNPASNSYIKNKMSSAAQAGISPTHIKLDSEITQEELLGRIRELNKDDSVNGLIVQMPLPKHIDSLVIEQAINPLKDVDGFHDINRGKLFTNNNDNLRACTPAGAIELLKGYDIEIAGKNCVIVNRSNLIGKPLTHMLLSENASVTILHSKSDKKALKHAFAIADIVFLGIGKMNSFKPTDFKRGAVVVDFSINMCPDTKKLHGDLDIKKPTLTNKHWLKAYTPVPGGCGQTTVAILMENVLRAYDLQKRLYKEDFLDYNILSKHF